MTASDLGESISDLLLPTLLPAPGKSTSEELLDPLRAWDFFLQTFLWPTMEEL